MVINSSKIILLKCAINIWFITQNNSREVSCSLFSESYHQCRTARSSLNRYQSHDMGFTATITYRSGFEQHIPQRQLYKPQADLGVGIHCYFILSKRLGLTAYNSTWINQINLFTALVFILFFCQMETSFSAFELQITEISLLFFCLVNFLKFYDIFL